MKRTKTPATKAATKNQNPKPAAAAAATAAAVDSDSDSKVSTAAAKTKKLPRGILERARAGDMQPLLDHFKETDLYSFAGTSLTNQEWAGLMPPWSGQKADRGLKHWKSETARGGFDFACLCGFVIAKSFSVYMELIALPPVVEGTESGATKGGLDFFKPFLLTLRLAYCKYLHPEVEQGITCLDSMS